MRDDRLEGRKLNPSITFEEAASVANPQYVYQMHKLSKAYPGGKQVRSCPAPRSASSAATVPASRRF